MLKFRLLKANEIDCRISTINEKGLSLLLYKDARVDQNILDETVGPMNWQRAHSRDNANCTVSIWDDEKKLWVSKEDTGTESYTDKEKGLASDSFKRACFNWGIGRELYTAPFIWISSKDCIIKAGKTGKPSCYDNFKVSLIEYDSDRCISALEIKNESINKVVFKMNNKPIEAATIDDDEPLEQKYVDSVYSELKRTGIGLKQFLASYGVNDVQGLTFDQYKDAMSVFEGKPDKAPAKKTGKKSGEPLQEKESKVSESFDNFIEPDDSSLPWNIPEERVR